MASGSSSRIREYKDLWPDHLVVEFLEDDFVLVQVLLKKPVDFRDVFMLANQVISMEGARWALQQQQGKVKPEVKLLNKTVQIAPADTPGTIT